MAASLKDAPTSAWPDRLPGRWIPAQQIGELLGRSSGQIKLDLQRLVERGQLSAEHPWPGSLRGYQLVADCDLCAQPLSSSPGNNQRQWMLDELSRWAAMHSGRAPARADWSSQCDPDREWPRATRVAAYFETEARNAGLRYFVAERCDPCQCGTDRHYINDTGEMVCMGCFDCRGECPHGDMGHWAGPSGWAYALQLAALELRTGGDHHATAAQQLGRNRKMVTGGAADQHPQHFRT